MAEEKVQVPANGPTKSVSWEASEYLEHDKDIYWTVFLLTGTIAISVFAILVMEDIFLASIVFVMAFALWLYGHRKPKTFNYVVDVEGVKVGDKNFNYSEFKSFSVIDEGPIKSIYLEPVKRFTPPITFYFDLENESQIVEVLSAHLPVRTRDMDLLDVLMKKLRF